MLLILLVLAAVSPRAALALDYPYAPYNAGRMDPQPSGWPLSDDERAFVLRAEYERRPGREANQHLPPMWPVTPAAGFWGGTSWLDTHAGLVEQARAHAGPVDVLLVGDSITMQWGAAWKKHFPGLTTVNIGIGGDKTQNVLWRLDHGGVAGLDPRVCVVLIGNNNMFFTPETGIEPVARGIKACVDNLREKFPGAPVIAVKVFPAHAPGNPFYEDIKKVNAALDGLDLERDPKVRVLDIWSDMVAADGTLAKDLFTPDNIHLTQEGGYRLYAEKLKPLLEALLAGKDVPKATPTPRPPAAPAGGAAPAPAAAPQAIDDGKLGGVAYPYAPYNEGKMDPQRTGWPLTAAERAWVNIPEYSRKPGHEVQKHLPDMWFVTPTAARWGKDEEENLWVAHHAALVEQVQARRSGIDVALLGDSITQGWGGGWDGAPVSPAWQRRFAGHETVNLGIGGDRIENILWRLDHGALDGASPRVVVLMIGVNNAPLVFANGASAAAAAQGIGLCVQSIRRQCPAARIVVVKVLPAFDPSREVGAKVREINAAVDALHLDAAADVHVLDLWREFTDSDGRLDTALYADGHLHLNDAGYEVLARGLEPLVASAVTAGR